MLNSNVFSTVAGPELGAAVQQAVDRQLSPALEAQGAEEAVGALAGLARALCMRGHAAAAGCIQRLVQLTSTAGGPGLCTQPKCSPWSEELLVTNHITSNWQHCLKLLVSRTCICSLYSDPRPLQPLTLPARIRAFLTLSQPTDGAAIRTMASAKGW